VTIPQSERITPMQFTFFIIQSQIGVGILSLPYVLHGVSKGGAWISALLAGVFVQLGIVLIWLLMKRFPDSTLHRVQTRITGKWVGSAFTVLYILYFVAVATMVLVLFYRVIHRWILMQTPKWVILLLMVITGAYLAREKPRTIARFYVMVSLLIAVLFALIQHVFMLHIDLTYMLPLTEGGGWKIFDGAREAQIAMLGFELSLVLFPLVEGTTIDKLKAATWANLFVTLFYAFTVFAVLIVFSPGELKLVPEPVLYMLKAFSFEVIERIDLIFLSIWIVSVATSFISYLFAASHGVGSLFFKGNHAPGVVILAVFCYLAAMVPQNKQDIEVFDQVLSWLSYVAIFAVPLLLYFLSLVTKKEEG
jgi:spore germination protein (amino acid permease)